MLDGGHRISVAIAWLPDDWGDNPELLYGRPKQVQAQIKDAARETKNLINQTIGTIDSFKEAAKEYDDISENYKKDPRTEMDDDTFRKARIYQKLKDGTIRYTKAVLKHKTRQVDQY